MMRRTRHFNRTRTGFPLRKWRSDSNQPLLQQDVPYDSSTNQAAKLPVTKVDRRSQTTSTRSGLYIKGKVNNTETDILIDSGADITVISRDFLNKIRTACMYKNCQVTFKRLACWTVQ